ncbi:MAG: hypothetical protein O9306_15610, partial [Beijerinckiaceae bacterium]|nr:hypothetical protein [Beijerinckiaceae bacterium]
TKVAQPLQPFVDIEKSRLASHRPSSPTVIGAIESETGRSGEVFRTVQFDFEKTNKKPNNSAGWVWTQMDFCG